MSLADLRQLAVSARPCRAGAPSAEPGDGARQRRSEVPLLTRSLNGYSAENDDLRIARLARRIDLAAS